MKLVRLSITHLLISTLLLTLVQLLPGHAARAASSAAPQAAAAQGRLPEFGEVLRGVVIPPDTRLPLASRWYYESREDKGYEYTRVRPLDDPANPYLGQYEDWDRWFYANYFQPSWLDADYEPQRQARIARQGGSAESWQEFYSRVSEDGWLIPQRQTWRFSTEVLPGATLASDQRHPYGRSDSERQFTLRSAGCMPAELARQRSRGEALAKAPDFPPIPAWLGENPPQEALVTLEGEWLCLGELGGSIALDDWQPDAINRYGGSRREPCYRYSAEGRLLGRVPKIGMPNGVGVLAAIYGDTLTAQQAQYTSGKTDGSEPNIYHFWWTGYGKMPDLEAKPRGPMELQWARDYRGREIDINAPLDKYYNTVCRPIAADELASVYQAQLDLGQTSAMPSPYAGTAEGPLLAGSKKPRPRTRWATARLSDLQYGYSNLVDAAPAKPLDAPGNPYAGQYSAIDEWVWQHEGWEDPEVRRRQLAGAFTTKLAGELEAPKLGSWQYISTRVNKDGFVLPLALSQRLDLELRCGGAEKQQQARSQLDAAAYLTAGGYVDEVLRRQLCAEIWPLVAGSYPRIPDWLAQQPVGRALILRSGEVVTFGELGSWSDLVPTEAALVLPPGLLAGRTQMSRAEFGVETDLCRYGPDGVLRSRFPNSTHAMDNPPWQALFEPGLAQVAQNARMLGQMVYSEGQYLAVQENSSSGGPSLYYDLNGTPLAANQIQPDAQTRWMEWSEIWAVWKLQQEYGQ